MEKYVTAIAFDEEEIEGTTPGKKYKVTYEGKDEIGIINDLGENKEYSKNCFKEFYDKKSC